MRDVPRIIFIVLVCAGIVVVGGAVERFMGEDVAEPHVQRDTVRTVYLKNAVGDSAWTRLVLETYRPIEPVPGQVYAPWVFVRSFAWDDSLSAAEIDSAVASLAGAARELTRLTETYQQQ